MEENELMNSETSSEEVASVEVSAQPVVQDAPVDTATPEASNASEAEQALDDKEKPMSRRRKILNGIFLGIQILLVIFAITLTLIMILNPKQDEVSSVGIKLLPVLSDSMDGSRTLSDGKTYSGFAPGALVIARSPKKNEVLKVGDIVTFSGIVNGKSELVTHRIVDVDTSDGYVKYTTQGDNPEQTEADSKIKHPGDIKAVYITHINKLGKALYWIRSGYHFIYIIIIPLGLLLIYNIYLVAQIVVESKMKKAKAAAAELAKQAALASIDEEEIKRKAIEEYLRQQAASSGSDDPNDNGGQ